MREQRFERCADCTFPVDGTKARKLGYNIEISGYLFCAYLRNRQTRACSTSPLEDRKWWKPSRQRNSIRADRRERQQYRRGLRRGAKGFIHKKKNNSEL